ncbi:MAG: hypothetical protein Q7T01_03820 [bacterium]|nr:hypothetical protein [bacterium]
MRKKGVWGSYPRFVAGVAVLAACMFTVPAIANGDPTGAYRGPPGGGSAALNKTVTGELVRQVPVGVRGTDDIRRELVRVLTDAGTERVKLFQVECGLEAFGNVTGPKTQVCLGAVAQAVEDARAAGGSGSGIGSGRGGSGGGGRGLPMVSRATQELLCPPLTQGRVTLNPPGQDPGMYLACGTSAYYRLPENCGESDLEVVVAQGVDGGVLRDEDDNAIINCVRAGTALGSSWIGLPESDAPAPQPDWWSKNWGWVVGGGVVTAVAAVVAVVAYSEWQQDHTTYVLQQGAPAGGAR